MGQKCRIEALPATVTNHPRLGPQAPRFDFEVPDGWEIVELVQGERVALTPARGYVMVLLKAKA